MAPPPQRPLGLALGTALLLVCALPSRSGAQAIGDWQIGRGTHYGNDAWSIHKGSCNYGYLYQDQPLGWNVAAMPDVSPDYSASCGTCYEIACNPSGFSDNYGQYLDRTQACFDSSKSLVVRIVDTCPCVYSGNSYSNKRWCCGDMPHLDVSIWAYERLADVKWGVIGLKFRRVPCDYQPDNVAPNAAYPTPGEQPPAWPKKEPIRDWPDVWSGAASPMVVYADSLQSGWADSSFNALYQDSAVGGLGGSGKALCYSLSPKGAISLTAPPGAFSDRIRLEFWLYMGTAQQAPKGTVVVIGGDSGDCTPIDLSELQATGFKPQCTSCTDYYWKFVIYLSAFAGYGPDSIINSPSFFKGCGDNTAAQLSYAEVRNYGQSDRQVCVDDVQLV